MNTLYMKMSGRAIFRAIKLSKNLYFRRKETTIDYCLCLSIIPGKKLASWKIVASFVMGLKTMQSGK